LRVFSLILEQRGSKMKKKKFHALLSLILAVSFLSVAFFSKNAEAIPTFARKYKTTCMTCHATYPRMTALGQAIRLNGLKMPDGDEIYIKEEVVSQGAEAYKRVFPDAVWPSSIPGPPPISIRVIGDLEVDIGDEGSQRDNRAKIEFPHELEVLFGGAFGDNMSFFGEIELEHPGEELEGATGGEYEGPSEIGFEAWLMWEDIIWPNYFNIKGGNIGGRETELPNPSDHDRITKEHYLYRDARILRGLGGPGVEFNGFGRNWRYAAGYVKPQDTFADGNYYGQVVLKFFGLGFDGSGGTTEEGGLEAPPSGYWRDDALFLGAVYNKLDDDTNRYGLDARVRWKDLLVQGGFAKLDDDNPGNNDKDVWFAEAEYFFFPWLQPYVRFESLSDDRPNQDLDKLLVGAAILARANVKFNVEARFFTENEPAVAAGRDKDVDDRFFVRLDFAF
jgi:hypothetical protein